MKKLVTLSLIIVSIISKAQCPWNFTLASTQNFMANCISTVVPITATHNSTNSVNYAWSGPSVSPATGSAVSCNAMGLYTVVATDAITSCSITKTFTTGAVPPVTFTVMPLNATFTITCTNSALNFSAASNYTFGALNYTWSAPGFTVNTNTVSVNAPQSVTLAGMDPATGCTYMQVFPVSINTLVPTNSVNPTSQAVACGGSGVTFSGTCSNPTFNIEQNWYGPVNPLPNGGPMVSSNNTLSLFSGSFAPGVYTLQTINQVNGCAAYKTFTITSLNAYPTFSLGSTTNFSLGCSPLNCSTLAIINPVSTQTPFPSTCSFTFLPPTFGGVVTPSVVLGANSSTFTCLPGTWTVIVQDNSNFCRNIVPVIVMQNTQAPNVSASMLTQTLSCYNPTVFAAGSSTTAGTVVSWLVPSIPPSLSQPTLIIGDPSNGPVTSNTMLTYANFTAVATNTINACQITSVIVIYQNFKKPISSPTIAIANPTAVTCYTGSPVILTTGSSTTTSGGGPMAYITNPCWQGPAPQTPTCGLSSYSCYVPGTYTLTVMDNYNGCTNSGTINIGGNIAGPVLSPIVSIVTVACNSTVVVNFVVPVVGSVANLRYFFYQYPQNASFSPTSAVMANINPVFNGTSSQTISVAGPASNYYYSVTNTLTGCTSYGILKIAPSDPIGTFTTLPGAPTCSACCDATMLIVPPGGFTTYSVSVTQGSVVGNPATMVGNLCYGPFKYCLTNTSTQCKWCDSIVIDGTTSMAKIESVLNEIIIYPNPTNSNLFIKSVEGKTGTFKIFNLEGKVIGNAKLESEKETEIKDLQSGIYFVEVNMEGIVTRKKVVVIR